MLSVDTSNGSSLMKALAVWPTEWVRHNSRNRANSRLPSERRATRSRRAPSKLVGTFPWRKAEAQGTAKDFSIGWFVSCDKQTRRERVEAMGGGSFVDDQPFQQAGPFAATDWNSSGTGRNWTGAALAGILVGGGTSMRTADRACHDDNLLRLTIGQPNRNLSLPFPSIWLLIRPGKEGLQP